jgi:sugar lactone lactonase YvrE
MGITQYQAGFSSRMLARFESATGLVWLSAPPGTIKPDTIVEVNLPGNHSQYLAPNDNGSLLFRYPGDENTVISVVWYEHTGLKHTDEIQVTDPLDDLETHIGETGLYCNRMMADSDNVWVVNSGDDELTPYDPDTLETLSQPISTPQYSNPWEAEFISGNKGLITTLFNGVYIFDALTGMTEAIDPNGFRDFASPNGVTIADSRGWVTNANPISYFPSAHGPGWVSGIDPDNHNIIYEIDTPWLNPQFVISGDGLLYVSCSGTVDFLPPNYVATAMTSGGVLIIDPKTSQIIKTYELGLSAPGTLALSPDNRYLYIGSGVAAYLFRIDLEKEIIINDLSNPIVISDFAGSYIPFITVDDSGLLAAASFNDDILRFVDSYNGQLDPYPIFKPIQLHPDDPDALWGPQDGVFIERDGHEGLLFMTTVDSAFHWIEI